MQTQSDVDSFSFFSSNQLFQRTEICHHCHCELSPEETRERRAVRLELFNRQRCYPLHSGCVVEFMAVGKITQPEMKKL